MEYKKCYQCGKALVGKTQKKFCSHGCNAKSQGNLTKYNTGRFGDKHPTWTGDKIQKDSLHGWIARMWGSPKKCDICGTTESPKFEWSNKNHTYKRNREDWQRLCKKCHIHYDIEHNGYIIHNPRKNSNTR